eukprot:382911_1
MRHIIMGAVLSDVSQCTAQVISETETTDEFISDSTPSNTKAVSSQNKTQPKESDSEDVDTNEFVSQFGSYFSATPSLECDAKIIHSSSSSADKTSSSSIKPLIDIQKSNSICNDNACKPPFIFITSASPQQPVPPSSSSSDTTYTVSSYTCSMSPVTPIASFH